MKLYLSSFRLGNHPERLVALLPPAARVAVICGELIWDGLGVLDHAIVPHLDSPGHPETDLVATVAELYDRTGVPYLPMRDGQALLVDGDHRELV